MNNVACMRARLRRNVLSQVFRDLRYICATDVVKTTGVYIETHSVYTRISNAFYAGLIVQRSLLLSGRIVTNGDPSATTTLGSYECLYLSRSTTSQ